MWLDRAVDRRTISRRDGPVLATSLLVGELARRSRRAWWKKGRRAAIDVAAVRDSERVRAHFNNPRLKLP
jgi:hypothetical protein